MDAKDPLLLCEHHGRDHLPWLLHELSLNPSILSHCFGEVGRSMDGLRFVNGKLLPLDLGLPSIFLYAPCKQDEAIGNSSA